MGILTKANRFALKNVRFIDINWKRLYNLTIQLLYVSDLCKKCLKNSKQN